ncbi:hypothetical protein ACHAW5_003680 [Stephanodiscus triporus]|uniref:Uncharacterized protein n=1 Tax=Stephanodiscus triporus TaxID=2934178 RepID=A0ABD3NJL1_9STRA
MGVSRDGDDGEIVRPSAPLEYLLPAARVGVYVHRALAVAEDLRRSSSGGTTRAEDGDWKDDDDATKTKRALLEGILLGPPSFVTSSDPIPTRGDPYVLPPLVGELVARRRKAEERRLLNVDAGFVPQLFEVGQLIGERRQWNRLSNEERAREGTSEVRLALNIYTTNLSYDPDRYVYAGSREERSRSIREGRLPTAGDVIRSDLDARDLYRNALQTSLDDARAEYLYQRGKNFEDLSELVRLLGNARDAIDGWFGFVPDRDVREALYVVSGEGRTR